ncbi:hypothetical protein FXO38_34231 [Capsicum annuum]|nr:hypothetical protein FXO38_34231 [Capsicum annuum]
MNRESRPYFILGVSQLESIKESQEVVNFVPKDFGYEIDGFPENRLKHKNDPQIMKKLRQKLAKKDKKKENGSKKRRPNSPASKAPIRKKRIVKEICRDELAKIIAYSSMSRLMKRYFPQSTNGVDKEILVERFLKGNFENKEDALQMAILYFIHIFIYSQLNASPVPFSDFKMVEDKKYQFFPWGKESFSRLMASLRQEFSMEKQLYWLGGIPQVLNVWMFEFCSNIDSKVVVKEGNNIPSILNWRVVVVRSQFNQFMTEIFSKFSYANIVPTADEFEKLDLARTSFASDHHGTSSMPSSSKNQDQRSYKVNLPQVTEDHDRKIATQVPKETKHLDDVADFECHTNPKTIVKQRQQECDPSDAIIDDVGPTSTDNVGKETNKSVKMEDDKAN